MDWIRIGWMLSSLKQTAKTLKIRWAPKGNDRILTIHVQVRAVSFTEAIFSYFGSFFEGVRDVSLYKLLVAKLRMPSEMKNHDIFSTLLQYTTLFPATNRPAEWAFEDSFFSVPGHAISDTVTYWKTHSKHVHNTVLGNMCVTLEACRDSCVRLQKRFPCFWSWAWCSVAKSCSEATRTQNTNCDP